jgi:hypothetical protein
MPSFLLIGNQLSCAVGADFIKPKAHEHKQRDRLVPLVPFKNRGQAWFSGFLVTEVGVAWDSVLDHNHANAAQSF